MEILSDNPWTVKELKVEAVDLYLLTTNLSASKDKPSEATIRFNAQVKKPGEK